MRGEKSFGVLSRGIWRSGKSNDVKTSEERILGQRFLGEES